MATMKQQRGFDVRTKHTLGPAASDSSSNSTNSSESSKIAVGVEGALRTAAAGHWQPIQSVPRFGLSPAGSIEVVGTATAGGKRLVREVVQGLRAFQEPTACREGLGGTYFFRDDRGANVAIIKPCDEEPLAPNNPKGFVGRELGAPGLKPTVRVGEAALREVAAYLLDYDSFAGVPHTVLVSISHPVFHVNAQPRRSLDAQSSGCSSSWTRPAAEYPASGRSSEDGLPPPKLASLQGFVAHTGDTNDRGTSQFSVAHVHRIGILDLRLYNTDRHAGNLLVAPMAPSPDQLRQRQRLHGGMLALMPIDHGFCLPEALEPPYFEWLHWPQAMLPFSREELDYIARLDAQEDCALLQRELPWLREAALRTLSISTLVLQAGAAAGLTLHEIGSVLSRSLVGVDEEPSQLEKLCSLARRSTQDCLSSSDSASSASEGEEEASISDFIAESWEEADTSQDSPLGQQRELQFELDSEPEDDAELDAREHLHGMPLPAGKQASRGPVLSAVSPASLSPLSSRSSAAFTVFPKKSFTSEPDSSDSFTLAPAALRAAGQQQRSDPHHIMAPRLHPAPSQPGVAKSVARGHMLRPGGPSARRKHRRREAAGAHKHRHHHPHRPAAAEQPGPESAGSAADPLGGMGEEEWPLFLATLKACVSEDLAAGRLGSSEAAAGGARAMAGTSCPAF